MEKYLAEIVVNTLLLTKTFRESTESTLVYVSLSFSLTDIDEPSGGSSSSNQGSREILDGVEMHKLLEKNGKESSDSCHLV